MSREKSTAATDHPHRTGRQAKARKTSGTRIHGTITAFLERDTCRRDSHPHEDEGAGVLTGLRNSEAWANRQLISIVGHQLEDVKKALSQVIAAAMD
jgi:hypothetical protein